eukprot:scaffold111_cov252-Pinguiococcus_pyrenoidosus.AAC.29
MMQSGLRGVRLWTSLSPAPMSSSARAGAFAVGLPARTGGWAALLGGAWAAGVACGCGWVSAGAGVAAWAGRGGGSGSGGR